MKPTIPPFSMGIIPEIKDYRTIAATSFQVPGVLPPSYFTDISMLVVEDQGPLGTCVWNSMTYVMALLAYWDNQARPSLSWRHGYGMTKFMDGIQDIQGCSYSNALKVAFENGCAISDLVPNDISLSHKDFINIPKSPEIFQNAYNYKIRGFASVIVDVEHMKQAIFKNGFVLAAINVGTDMTTLPLKPTPFYGRHGIFIFGYEDKEDGSTDFRFLNSWSKNWGDHGMGKINSRDYFTPIATHIDSIFTVADIPQALIDEAKRLKPRPQHQFTKNLKQGDYDEDVRALQDILRYEGCMDIMEAPLPSTTYYGESTRKGVLRFQQRYQVVGIRDLLRLNGASFGPATIAVMNNFYAPGVSLLDKWCLAIQSHEGYYAAGEHLWEVGPYGSPSFRNNNPGNIKYIGQQRAIGKDPSGFAIFKTYADGYAELRDMLVRCATGKNVPLYKSTMTLLDFFRVYAPSSDKNDPNSYATDVSKKLKVDINTQIKDLI